MALTTAERGEAYDLFMSIESLHGRYRGAPPEELQRRRRYLYDKLIKMLDDTFEAGVTAGRLQAGELVFE